MDIKIAVILVLAGMVVGLLAKEPSPSYSPPVNSGSSISKTLTFIVLTAVVCFLIYVIMFR